MSYLGFTLLFFKSAPLWNVCFWLFFWQFIGVCFKYMSRQASFFLFVFRFNPSLPGSTVFMFAALATIWPPKSLNQSWSVRSAAGSRVLWESRRHPVRKQMWPGGSESSKRRRSSRPGRDVRVCLDSSAQNLSLNCLARRQWLHCLPKSAWFCRLQKANICVHVQDVLLDTPLL